MEGYGGRGGLGGGYLEGVYVLQLRLGIGQREVNRPANLFTLRPGTLIRSCSDASLPPNRYLPSPVCPAHKVMHISEM